MGKLGLTGLSVILASAGAWGCSASDHPSHLHYDGGGGFGAISGSGGSSGEGGDAATCNPNPNSGVRFEGNVIIREINFEDHVGFAGKADLTMEGIPCGWAKATYDGAAPPQEDGGPHRFLIEGVKPTTTIGWLHVYQAEGSNEDVYPTLNPINTGAEDFILDDEFGFYRKSAVDKIYSDTGTTRDTTKGTVLIRLVSGPMSVPAPGASISTPVGLVAYPLGGTWAIDGVTDDTGMVAVLNADAKPFPGASVGFEVIENKQKFPLAVEEGVVTLGYISLASWAGP